MEKEIKKGSIVYHDSFGEREVVEVRDGCVYVDFKGEGTPSYNRNIIKVDGKHVFGYRVDSVKLVPSRD